MKKAILTIIPLFLAFVLLAACSAGELPDGMDKAAAEAKAQEIVQAMATADYEQVLALYGTEALADKGIPALTIEDLAANGKAIEEEANLGAFTKFTSTRYTSVEDENFGLCGVVILGCQYENKSVAWQVVLSPDMDIIGMWV